MTDRAVISNWRTAFSVTVMMVMTGGLFTITMILNRFQTYANISHMDVEKRYLPVVLSSPDVFAEIVSEVFLQ